MELKQYSKDELMDFLTNGIPMPETALTNKDTIKFYFEELEGFINIAENDFWAKSSVPLQITVSFGTEDYIVMRVVDDNIVLFMASDAADDIENMTSQAAQDIIGLVYGIIVFNEKWKEVSVLADQLMNSSLNSTSPIPSGPIKINSIEMENLKQFIKRNKKYM